MVGSRGGRGRRRAILDGKGYLGLPKLKPAGCVYLWPHCLSWLNYLIKHMLIVYPVSLRCDTLWPHFHSICWLGINTVSHVTMQSTLQTSYLYTTHTHTHTHIFSLLYLYRLIPIEELSVGQFSVLRKLSLIKLTALIELYKSKSNMWVANPLCHYC